MGAKLWGYIAAAGAFIAAFFVAYSKGASAKADEISAETSKKTIDINERISTEIIEGQDSQQEILDEKIDASDRNHFS